MCDTWLKKSLTKYHQVSPTFLVMIPYTVSYTHLYSVSRMCSSNEHSKITVCGADRSVNHRIKLEYLQVTSGVGVRAVASVGLNIAGEKFEGAAKMCIRDSGDTW